MPKLTEERVREIAREEILAREIEKIRLIASIDALAKKGLEKQKGTKKL